MVKTTRRRVGSRSLGQNFLVDRNILDVIERLAELSPDDVVLEIGGGLGVLSERLAAVVGFLHVVEVDERLLGELREALDAFPNAALHAGDAVGLDYRAFDPAPTKLVANLPYSVAATVILKTVDELPSVERWVVMVQREVGERLAAAPGGAAYGVPSVLAQLVCDVRILRPVARTVFRPVPNVDSVLLGLTRRRGPDAAPADPAVRRLVHEAFAHRRKALARSLALAPGADDDVRNRARGALADLGFPADVRAERLSPGDFRALAERMSR